MPAFDLFSVGHSNLPAERFLALLDCAGVEAIADIRSAPVSRWFPWFSKKPLQMRLEDAGIAYEAMGDSLGGRPRAEALYREGVADYEAMAMHPEYRAGIEHLLQAVTRSRVCLLCAEREPLDCHRCLLVGRSLAERGLAVGHILHDGTIAPHAATEQRLLGAAADDDGDLFAAGRHERLAAAYRRQARAVAFRQPGRSALVERI